MTSGRPSALIADDEPLLRKAMVRMLMQAWPELEVVAQARNGREAVELFESRTPDVCFLDVHMPGLSGVEAAQFIGDRAHVVFVTAYDQYAVQAFEHGALDYLVKPVEAARLATTVTRLQDRLGASPPARDTEALLEQLAARLRRDSSPPTLRWLRVSAGQVVRVIAVEEIEYLRAEDKYTLVAWRVADGSAFDGLIRTPLKELLTQLDGSHFVQVHRAVVVNLGAVSHVVRRENETAELHLKGRAEWLPVSRTHLHLFRQM